MGKWEEKKVGECLIEIQTGKTPPKNRNIYYENSTIDWFSPSDFDDDVKELSNSKNKISEIAIKEGKARIYPLNSLLLVGIGATVGKVGLLKFSASSNQQITALTFDKNLDVDFAYYWFRNIKDHIVNMASSATMPIINQKEIKKLPIRFPKSLPEQQRIVAKLDGLFAKIDQAIGLLEENIGHTQALMGSVLDEEFGKLSKFNKPLMSFCANPKKDMVGGPFGSNLKASEYVEKGYPIIRLQNVDRFNFKEKNIMFVTEEKADFLSSHSYISGDIVMTKLGDPLGKCCVVEDVHGVDRGVISSDIIRIRIDENKNYKPYVVAGINSEYFIKQLKSKTQGSTRPRVKLKEVREMQLPMLKKDEQIVAAKRIDGILELQSKVLTTQTEKLTHLKALKSSLLDQAFKGEL